MDASYKIQRGIHVHLIQFFMCPEFWVHIIVTTSALFCDSMITEIAQIGDVRKYPADKYSQQGIFVSLRPLCANFELLRYQRCSLDTFFFFGLAECDIAGRDEVTSPYTLRWCISDHVKISTQRSL